MGRNNNSAHRPRAKRPPSSPDEHIADALHPNDEDAKIIAEEVFQLSIEGRADDGCYPLSKIQVVLWNDR